MVASLEQARVENQQSQAEITNWRKLHELKDGQVKLAEQSNKELRQEISTQDGAEPLPLYSPSHHRDAVHVF